MDGLIVVDKPAGMTSHDVVGRVRRLARTRRVGHAGTLDPMATGVLVIGVNRATRLLTYLVGCDKSYLATIRLGEATVTDDAEGELTSRADASGLGDDDVRRELAVLVGEIDQVPSAVSAIKVNGVRAYARVRGGEAVALAARRVTIGRIDVLAIRRAEITIDVDVSVTCSSGTYIRAIARDVGAAFGVGGHLTSLRRTRVGGFVEAEAQSLDHLAELEQPVTIPLERAVSRVMPREDVSAEHARVLANGGPIPARGHVPARGQVPARGHGEPYGVFGPDGAVLAIVTERGGRAWPEVVLRPASAQAGKGG